ncbi:FtsX-like permease family protein [Fodinicola feengrottensis]|uniref:FtsX-like permease family protein n=1 Tax=Fodinicola feengrottensis TaxID=435914 RepID=A0ABN2H1G3_9ACTN
MSVLRTQLRGLASRPTRLLLTSLAVIVATAFAYATFLVQSVVEQSLQDSFSTTTSATSVVVKSSTNLPDSAAGKVRALQGVSQVAEQGVTFIQGGGLDFFVQSDPGSGPLSLVSVVSGHYPTAAGQIAVSEDTAKKAHLKIGDTLPVQPSEQGKKSIQVTVTAIVSPHGRGADVFVPASGLTALGAHFNRLNISATAGTDTAALVSSVKSAVGGTGITVDDAATIRQSDATDVSKAVGELFLVLGLFVLVAVLAAGLVAAATFRIVFAQRMRQLALLRAIGAKRDKIIGALVIEGAITGLVAGVLGVVLSAGIAYGAIAIINSTGSVVPFPGLNVLALLGCVAGAVLVTVGSVLAPAISASRVPPLAALRTAAVADGAKKVGWLRMSFGILLVLAAALAGVAATVIHSSTGALIVVVSGAFAFGALLTLGPYVVPSLARLLGWPAGALARTTGRLAIRNAARSPRRIAATTSVVALGVTLVTGLLVGTASMQAYADARLSAEFPTAVVAYPTSGATPAQLQALAKNPAIARAVPKTAADVTISAQGARETLPATGLDASAVPSLAKVAVAGGRPSDVGVGDIGLHSDVAAKLGVHIGDSVAVSAGNRSVTLKVTATWQTAFGPALLMPSDLRKIAPNATVSTVLVDPAAGHTVPEIRKIVSAALPNSQVQDAASARESFQGPLATVTLIALGLLALTVLIAVTGVATTMTLAIVERTTESGLLRALGLSRQGLRGSLMLESGVFGLVGAAIGLVLGSFYAWRLLDSLSLGVSLVLPVGELVLVAVVLVALTLLAGWLPSRRAARISPVDALATS